jgi:uncharacterized protein (TIGR03067 family)
MVLRASGEVKTEIDGTWEVTRFNEQGTDTSEPVRSKLVVVRENGIQTTTKDGKPWGKKSHYSIAPNTAPKQIAFSDPDQPDKITHIGIYEIKGDTMKMAGFVDRAKRTTERPKDFTPAEGKVVSELKRVKEKKGE